MNPIIEPKVYPVDFTMSLLERLAWVLDLFSLPMPFGW